MLVYLAVMWPFWINVVQPQSAFLHNSAIVLNHKDHTQAHRYVPHTGLDKKSDKVYYGILKQETDRRVVRGSGCRH